MIYFAKDEIGSIKIGTSKNVEQRIKELSCGSSGDIKLLKSTPGGRSEEHRLHIRFKHLRIRGEWFKPEPELLEFIDSYDGDKTVPKKPRRKAEAIHVEPEIDSPYPECFPIFSENGLSSGYYHGSKCTCPPGWEQDWLKNRMNPAIWKIPPNFRTLTAQQREAAEALNRAFFPEKYRPRTWFYQI